MEFTTALEFKISSQLFQYPCQNLLVCQHLLHAGVIFGRQAVPFNCICYICSHKSIRSIPSVFILLPLYVIFILLYFYAYANLNLFKKAHLYHVPFITASSYPSAPAYSRWSASDPMHPYSGTLLSGSQVLFPYPQHMSCSHYFAYWHAPHRIKAHTEKRQASHWWSVSYRKHVFFLLYILLRYKLDFKSHTHSIC